MANNPDQHNISSVNQPLVARITGLIARAAGSPITARIIQAIRVLASLALGWLVGILLLSTYEYINHSSGHATKGLLWSKLESDFLFWIRSYLPLAIGFCVVTLLSPRIARWACIAIILFMILGQTMLMKYFSSALVPLGADLYGYSLHDITQTAGASGSLHLTDILMAVAFMLTLFWLLSWISRKSPISKPVAITIACLSVFVVVTRADRWIPIKKFASEYEANLNMNKLEFFLSQSEDHFFPDSREVDIYTDEYAGVGDEKDNTTSNAIAAQFIYPDEGHYPFYHLDSTRDVLSPFFTPAAATPGRLPNIVIILVEGLGRAFTNKGAYLGNFTPFIDSLSGSGLYWKNFLSQGGRTFAVLPSISGSLPFAKNGFLELGSAMPGHLSLINSLHEAGYHSSFYYGGESHFDNMDLLLNKEGIDEINDEKTYPSNDRYVKLPAQNGFTWGYNDASLFNRWLDSRIPDSTHPQLSIVLTVSTHSPFVINDPATYEAKFEKRMEELGFNEAEKTAHRTYKAQYMSILYTDDCLRDYFQSMAQRPDYKNTIFLITGDHRMPEIPMRTKIDRYHVPLIVYSPLLHRRAEFQSISTHYDITPSLLAFLHASYGIPRPAAAQWMGAGLDTAQGFRNIHAYPLMQTKTDLVDFVKGEFHLNNGQLFRLSPDMDEEPATTPQSPLPNLFNAFLRKNEKLAGGAPLVPDSAMRK